MAAPNRTQEKRLQALASLQAQSDKQLAQLDQSHNDAEEKIIPPLEDAEKMNAIINDLNQFKMLYEAQTAAAEQTEPLETPPDADRTPTASRSSSLAGTEKEMEQALSR